MSVDKPFNIYQEQLSSQYYGLALWDPNPVQGLFNNPGHVSIGDVGYLDNGTFMRIFNVKLPRDDPSNTFIKIPEGYKPLKREHFNNVRHSEVNQEEYHSHVSKVDYVRANTHEEYMGQSYECWAQSHGALLSLPHGARSEDVIRTKLFEDYIRDNVDSWLRWSKKEGLPVENTEDLILVTGCTLAKSWAVAVFDGTTSSDGDVTISLEVRKSDGGEVQFVWHDIRGSVAYHHNDSNIEGTENQCIFIRGFRKRSPFGIGLFQIGSTLLRIGSTLLRIGSGKDDENPQRPGNSQSPLYRRNNGLRNTYIRGSTIGPSSINRENPQLRRYPSSTALQSNGDIYNASFMTSPSDSSPIEAPSDIAEVHHEDIFAEDTSYNHGNNLPFL